MTLPGSKKAAKEAGVRFYFTGLPCPRGHIEKRYAAGGSCVICANDRAANRYLEKTPEILVKAKDRYAKNPEKIKRRVAARKAENPEKVKAEKRTEYQRHRSSYITRAATWAKLNPEKMRECQANWVRNNPDKAYQITVRRRARLKQRLPLWLTETDHAKMREIYAEARRLSEETGVPHQVDHILPILGCSISGLHVPENLRIITAKENQAKGNRFIPR